MESLNNSDQTIVNGQNSVVHGYINHDDRESNVGNDKQEFGQARKQRRGRRKRKAQNISLGGVNLEDNIFECVNCGNIFKTDSELRSHIDNIHNGTADESIPCYYCDEILSSDLLLKLHTETIHRDYEISHGNSTSIFDCDICEKKFSSKDAWLVHSQNHMKNDAYKCRICRSEFFDKNAFLVHVMLHTPEKNHACSFCEERFVYGISLKEHCANEHSSAKRCKKRKVKVKVETRGPTATDDDSGQETASHSDGNSSTPKRKYSKRQPVLTKEDKLAKTVRCQTCGFMFETEERMLEHARKHLECKRFVCEICGAAYKEQKTFEAHKFVHTGQTPFECDECDKSFRSRGLLAGHKRKHKPVKRDFVCSICGKAYRSLSTLSIHEATHTDVKPCHCEVCGKGFSNEGNLKRHMSMHTGEMRFSCEHCRQEFRVKRSMYAHMEKHVAEKKYTCAICDKKFAYDWNRKEHQRAHEYVRGYRDRHGPASEPVIASYKSRKGVSDPGGKCDICGKYLPTGFGLYRHTVMHKREPLTCGHCGLTFTLKLHYDNHQAVHSGTAFTCGHCSKEFVTEERMRIHEREVHTGDKPYQCQNCNEAFTTRLRLKAHGRVHKGTAIRCQHCNKLFISKFALEKHMRQHNPDKMDKPYPCTKCTKTFKDEYTLIRHLHSHRVQKVDTIVNDTLPVQQPMQPHLSDITTGTMDESTVHAGNGSTVVVHHNHILPSITPPMHPEMNEYIQQHEQQQRQHHQQQQHQQHQHQHQQQHQLITYSLPPAREVEIQFEALNDVRGPYHISNDDVHGTVYVCDLCQQAFLNAESLVEHSKLHSY